MNTLRMYNLATRNGCQYEANCTEISINTWERLMKGHTRANKKLVVKVALLAGVIEKDEAARELRNPWYNPYHHYKTKTHLIYVHSCIEHFIRIY